MFVKINNFLNKISRIKRKPMASEADEVTPTPAQSSGQPVATPATGSTIQEIKVDVAKNPGYTVPVEITQREQSDEAALAQLKQYVTVPVLISFIKERWGFSFSERQILDLARRRSAVLRIGSEIGIDRSKLSNDIVNIMGNTLDQYTKSSAAKRNSQLKTTIVRKHILKRELLQLISPIEEDTLGLSAEDAEKNRVDLLKRMTSEINTEIETKSKNQETIEDQKTDSFKTGPVKAFTTHIDLENFLEEQHRELSNGAS